MPSNVDRLLSEQSLEIISGLISSVLKEEVDNPVVKNISAKENFDDYVSDPKNQGEPFNDDEFSVVKNLDSQPYKKTNTELRFSSTEVINNRNKELAVVKKQGRYVAFFSVRKPTDVSTTVNLGDVSKEDEDDGRDDIIIKVSRPFSKNNSSGDPSLLYNFINFITKEYEI
jgi:hypothetical protein